MTRLSDKQTTDYFHRCFTAVDGLWFLKLEEKFGFDTALQIDNEVWKVFPKIQAREMKAMLKLENGFNALKTCFITAFELKGFTFNVDNVKQGKGFDVIITRCPWHDTMVKSHREHLSVKVGKTVCPTEYSTWAKEFGDNIEFNFDPQIRICAGGRECVLHFIS